MKKTYSIFILQLIFTQIIAQSNIRLNNYWDNAYNINPATINTKFLAEFTASTSKQWINVPGAPTTVFVSATTYIEKWQSQFGIKLRQDQIGYISTSQADLSYSFQTRIDKEWRFVFGLSGNYEILTYDPSKVRFGSLNGNQEADLASFESMKIQNNSNADLGFEVSSNTLRIGLAGQKIFGLFSPNSRIVNGNTNFLYAMYRESSPYLVSMGYGLSVIQTGPIIQLEANISSFMRYDEESDPIQLGVSYRTRNQFAVFCGLFLGEKFKLSYNYGLNMSQFGLNTYGSHEVILRYRLQRDSNWGWHNYHENQTTYY